MTICNRRSSISTCLTQKKRRSSRKNKGRETRRSSSKWLSTGSCHLPKQARRNNNKRLLKFRQINKAATKTPSNRFPKALMTRDKSLRAQAIPKHNRRSNSRCSSLVHTSTASIVIRCTRVIHHLMIAHGMIPIPVRRRIQIRMSNYKVRGNQILQVQGRRKERMEASYLMNRLETLQLRRLLVILRMKARMQRISKKKLRNRQSRTPRKVLRWTIRLN